MSVLAASTSGSAVPFSLFQEVWTKCVVAEAGIYAETSETADVIATVAEAKCEQWADKVRESWLKYAKKMSPTAIDQGLAQIRASNRAKALEAVLDWRLRFRTNG
jgi:hypothetical protein